MGAECNSGGARLRPAARADGRLSTRAPRPAPTRAAAGWPPHRP